MEKNLSYLEHCAQEIDKSYSSDHRQVRNNRAVDWNWLWSRDFVQHAEFLFLFRSIETKLKALPESGSSPDINTVFKAL